MGITRAPVVAGRFYPGTSAACRRAVDELLQGVSVKPALGAVVPHAGWLFSGSTAALALTAVADWAPDTIVVFGAVHTMDSNDASMFASGAWETPLGALEVDEDLARQFAGSRQITIAPHAHRNEHSIEVQLPLLKVLAPMARLLPISVRPGAAAPTIGHYCANVVRESGKKVVFVASTDLTHYGPAFGFEPMGHGEPGVRWAKDVNDRRLIALIDSMREADVVPEAAANHNACGGGAVAALLGAMNEIGGLRYQELRHTCSAECEIVTDRDPDNSVGYEAGVFRAAPTTQLRST